MRSETARQYIINNLETDIGNDELKISATVAIGACEIAERETKQRAISGFRKFVDDYCNESGRKDISANANHYIRVFESLID